MFSARAIADVNWLEQLKLQKADVETIDLDERRLSDAGVRALLLAAGGHATAFAAQEGKVHALTARTTGDPLLLKFLVEDIAENTFREVPDGLNDYLNDWWQAISDSAAEALRVQQLLGYLVAARGRLTRDDLIAIGPPDVLNRFNLDNALKSMHRFVLGDRYSGYALCHPLFQDYVAHNIIAGDLSFRKRLLNYCERWAEHKSLYVLSAYPRHLLEAVGEGAPEEQQAVFDCLAQVLTDKAYQRAYMGEVGDFGALQQTMRDALRSAPEAINDTRIIFGVIRLALTADALQRSWLDPEGIFESAAAGELERAEEKLRLFGPDLEWRQLAYAVIAWLVSHHDADAAKQYLSEHAVDFDPAQMWYALLPERVRADLKVEGAQEPPLIIPYAGPFGGQPLPNIADLDLAQALVARIGGQLGENPSAFDYERLHAGQDFSNMDYGVETPKYVVENDSPQLVAVAERRPVEGMELLQQYIAVHCANPYRVYRNRSLFGIAGAVICHSNLRTAMELLQLLIAGAFQPGGAEYTEPLLIALTALKAASGDVGAQQRLDEMQRSAEEATGQLYPLRGSSDSWGHHCRRLAMLAEGYCVAMGDLTAAASLFNRARGLPFGYAGFQAPASLALAESFRICQPHNEAARSEVRERALRSAHKVQEPPFCAATTARVNAMVTKWWEGPIHALDEVIAAFHANPADQDFTALHMAGEQFENRGQDRDMLPIPQEMRIAATLQDIARHIYRLPIAELLRVNPDMDPNAQLQQGAQIHIPDPSFTPLLAARLAAEVVAERDGFGGEALGLLMKLVPGAVGNTTALILVLARTLLTLGPAASDVIAGIEALTSQEWMAEPEKPPRGVTV